MRRNYSCQNKDIVSHIAFSDEDKALFKPIIKNLINKKILVSSKWILEGINKNSEDGSFGFFGKLLKKIVHTFNSDSNIEELSKGLYCPIDLINERAKEIESTLIGSIMITERKLRDFLWWKYKYSDIEEELLLMHMKNNKTIEICKITIKDETTGEEANHRAVYSLENIDKNEQRNLKLIELEINLYSLNDATIEIEEIKEKANK